MFQQQKLTGVDASVSSAQKVSAHMHTITLDIQKVTEGARATSEKATIGNSVVGKAVDEMQAISSTVKEAADVINKKLSKISCRESTTFQNRPSPLLK